MATPEDIIDGKGEIPVPTHRRHLQLVLGEHAVGPISTEPRQEYVPYDGANPLIDEENWASMDYGRLATIRANISASFGLLLEQRRKAEIAQQWDEFIALEDEVDIMVSKISWLNGMLKDRRN